MLLYLVRAKVMMLAILLAPAVYGAELVMVEQPGCHWCTEWNATIAPIYHKSAEGRFAPLRRATLRSGAPEGVTYARPVVYTPTFVLVESGREVARIEGYPGEDFFWGLLEMMLEQNLGFSPEKRS